jgi:CHAT domain-containing protein/Tfp pilus assembly protein PilF
VSNKKKDKIFSEKIIEGISLLKVSRTESNIRFEEALKIAEEIGDKNKQLSCLVSLAIGNNNINDYSKSIEYLEKALLISKQIKIDNFILLNINIQYAFAYEGLKRYIEAIMKFKEALNLAQEMGNKEMMLVCHMSISFDYIDLKEYWNCIQHLETAVQLAEELGIKRYLEGCYYGLGVVYNYQFQYQKAITYLEKALPLKIELGDKRGESDCYLSLSSANNNLSNYQKAITYLEKALPLKIELGDRMGESMCYLQGGISFKGTFEYQKAITYLEKALPLKIELGDRMGEAECYINLGLVYFNLSDYQKAITNLETALDISEKIENAFEKSVCYINLGLVYFNLSDYQKAIMYFEKALELKMKLGDKMGVAICYGNLGNFYHSIGKYNEARNFYLKTLEESKIVGNKDMELDANLDIAGTFLDSTSPDPSLALPYISNAQNIANQINDKKAFMKINALYGKIYAIKKEYDNSLEQFNQSLQIAQQLGDKNMENLVEVCIGVCYSELGQYNAALDRFQKSLEIAKRFGNQERMSFILTNLGVIMYHLENFEQSYLYLKDAAVKSESIGVEILDNDFKIQYYGKKITTYQYLILVCSRLKKFDEVYEYARKSKSKAFLELLTGSNIKPRNTSVEINNYVKQEEALLNKRRILQNKYLHRDFITEYSKVNVNVSDISYSELVQINSELDSLYSEMEKIDPEYVSLRRLKEITIKEIQQLISEPDTIVVEYYIMNDQVYIFIISKDKFDTKIIHFDTKQFDQYIKNFVSEVINHREYVEEGHVVINQWKELGKLLLEPITEHLRDIKNIYFIPHNVLHYIPLHALELDKSPLIKKYGVIFLQNVGLLKYYENIDSQSITSCLAVGLYKGNENSFLYKEANEVAKIYNSKALIDAPKSQIINSITSELLHFATHGKYEHNNPLLSELLVNEKEKMTVKEIFDLKLNAKLVTLSACESGFNKYHPGDELMGLTRAFTYAGAGSLIVSLWNVYDPSTYELMLKFYRNLKKGMTKVSALRDAQIQLMDYKAYSHPYFWAPFILIGNSF